MADNTTLNVGTGGDIIATDDIGGVKHQLVKMEFGVDGAATQVSASDPLPVVAALPSGAATAANQATEIASLATLAGAVAGTEVQVDVLSSALPSGAATAARQDTGNTALAAIQTAVEILDNAVSGSEFQVDIVSSALPSGAATEATLSTLNGKVTACNTGAVVVSSSALPSGASTAAKQPALGTAGTASADVITVQGIASMTALVVDGSAVTQPVSHAALTELAAAIDTELQVDVVGALPAGTNNIGDVDVLSLPALPSGTNNIGDVDVLTVPSDPFGANADAGSATGSISAKLRFIASTGIPITGTVTVGSHAVTNAGTFAVQPAGSVAHDADATAVNPNLMGGYSSAAAPTSVTADGEAVRAWYLRNGAQAAVLTAAGALIGGDATNGLDVDVTRIKPDGTLTLGMVDETGSSAVDAAAVGGGTPHDSVDSGNPLKLGAKVETSPKGITLVADGDRTNLYADADGILLVKLNTSNADIISERIADTSGTSTAFSNFGAVANTYNYVTAVSAFNSSAGAAYLDIRDGTAGAVLYTLYLPAGGGAVIPCGSHPLFKSSANTALAYDVSAATTTVYINMSGFQSKA